MAQVAENCMADGNPTPKLQKYFTKDSLGNCKSRAAFCKTYVVSRHASIAASGVEAQPLSQADQLEPAHGMDM